MNYYNVGRIINTHGIKGEVKVVSVTDFPKQRFQAGKILYLDRGPRGRLKLQVDNARPQMNLVLLHFKGYSNINEVQFMKGKRLQVSEADMSAQDLKPGEYYFHQILGLDVFDLQGRHLGKIKNIMKTGANDVWVVARPHQKSLLLPKIKPVIKEVDLGRHLIKVQLMKGMD